MIQDNMKQQFIPQLESVIEMYNGLKSSSKYDDISDAADELTVQTVITRARAAIERISGSNSAYSTQAKDILNNPKENDWGKMPRIVGVASSLLNDLKAGYLASLKELIHGELFADFLEMAAHLQNEGYKDAAAVIAGGTLETHLRQLCIKHNIDIEVTTPKGLKPKKADRMNADLSKINAYSKLDHKNVTAWLDLRNKAAHGLYSEYSKEQVDLLVTGIRDFITRNAA
jgi:hypothetical protein